MTDERGPTRALYQERAQAGAPNASDARCLLCPRRCVIPDGSAGFCGSRANRGGVLVAEGYAVVSALALDPIEKKPLARFKPGSAILSVGGFGCNLSCKFCQNHRIARARPPSAAGLAGERAAGRSAGGDRDFSILAPENLVGSALSCRDRGNVGLAFTYNEPLINIEYVTDCARLAKDAGLDVVLVTNGYVNPGPLEELLPFVDAMNVDLKAFTDGFYESVCGGTRRPVMETIERAAGRCHVEVTTLVIPGLNSGYAEIDALASWLASVSPSIPLHLTRHHPDYLMSESVPIEPRALLALVEVASARLETVIAGNLRNFP